MLDFLFKLLKSLATNSTVCFETDPLLAVEWADGQCFRYFNKPILECYFFLIALGFWIILEYT